MTDAGEPRDPEPAPADAPANEAADAPRSARGRATDKAAEKAGELAALAAPIANSFLAQTKVNLLAWVPFLQNPGHKAGLIRYPAGARREGGAWRINLPKMCCECGVKERLKTRKLTLNLRCFEFPIPIAVVGLTFAGILAAISAWFLFTGGFSTFVTIFGISVLTFAATAGLLFLKSWTEEVILTVSVCSTHAERFKPPDLASDLEYLNVVVLDPALAEAARAELKAERRAAPAPPVAEAEAKTAAPKSKSADRPQSDDSDSPPTYARPASHELPSISLDDDGTSAPPPKTPPPAAKPVAAKERDQKPVAEAKSREPKPAKAAPEPPSHAQRPDLPPIKLDD